MKRALVALGALAAFHVGASALAQDPHGHGAPPRLAPQTGRPPAIASGAAHGPAAAGAHGPAAAGPAAGAHGDGHGDAHGDGHHGPGHINWMYGLIAERSDVKEPSLLWRPKGMPAPYAASLINFAAFAYIIARLGKKPIMDGLKKRRDDLMRDIDEAGKVRDEAEERLAEYEEKLDNLESEVDRVKKDYEEQAKRDEARILAEAKERREKMKKDAELTVAQEARELEARLLAETVARASVQAETLVKQRLTAQDHDRLAEELLADLGKQTSLGASA